MIHSDFPLHRLATIRGEEVAYRSDLAYADREAIDVEQSDSLSSRCPTYTQFIRCF